MAKTNVLLFVPELAAVIGLNQAIILNQVHYWIQKNKADNSHFHKGRTWVFNTYKEWKEQFPFWSKNTIVRTFERLEKNGLLISENFNKKKYDRTKWYTIDYDKLNSVYTRNGEMQNPFWDDGIDHYGTIHDTILGKPIPENTTKNTQRECNTPTCEQGDCKGDGKVGYGAYGRVLLSDDEMISLLVSYGEQAVDRAIGYVDTSAQTTDNRNGWRDWRLTVERAIRENWGGIMNDIGQFYG